MKVSLPIVAVHWIDSALFPHKWKTEDELSELFNDYKDCSIETVGYLYREFSDCIVIASSIWIQGDGVSLSIQIPLSAILSITNLRTGKPYIRKKVKENNKRE